MDPTRRDFVRLAASAGVVAFGGGGRAAAGSDGLSLAKYVDALPRLPVAVPREDRYPHADYYELTILQRPWRFHRDLPVGQAWGFWAAGPPGSAEPAGLGYLGPTVVTRRQRPLVVRYRNHLPATHLLQPAIDVTLWRNVAGVPPDPPGGRMPRDFPAGMNVWNVVHIHGAFQPPQSDGNPEAWFTPVTPGGGHHHGPAYVSLRGARPDEAIYGYPNDQRATMLWYHDHAMGITRLNKYAGLAGVYLIRDSVEDGLALPRDEYEVPLVVQDRTFTADGALSYPTSGPSPYHPKWVPNFFGDTPVVNGKAYPFMAVEPRRYRLRLLNASNQRFFHLWFEDGSTRRPCWLIGTDGGLRAEPLRLTGLWLPPAARLDLIVDFADVAQGTRVTLRNDAATPYPEGGKGSPMPEIMQFQVTRPLSGPDRTMAPERLVLPPIEPLRPTPGLPRRDFVLIANKDAAGKPMHLAINQRFFTEPVEDFPGLGTTEIWEYANSSSDAHPIHVHLVQFQIMNRQRFNAAAYGKAYKKWVGGGRIAAAKPVLNDYLVGAASPPAPEEVGWKDIVIAQPGMVSRIVVRFDLPRPIPGVPGTEPRLPAEYIHHCHMLEHEDNEMMRPWQVVA